MNPFIYSDDHKRYYTYNYYLRNKYHSKVVKISLDAGFDCPHQGCLYCSRKRAGDFCQDATLDLQEQFERQKEILSHKWPNAKYIAYFQAGTNTYGPMHRLKECFEPFTIYQDVVGICIATRPDCLNDEVMAYLSDLNQRTDLCIELGLQTIHQKTSELILRGHDLKCFEDAVSKLRKAKIDICVHIINGLPNETKEMMLQTARYVSQLDIQFLKIHMLYITDDAPLYPYYKQHPFKILEKDEYIDIVIKQLELLRKEIVIERLTGDGDRAHLISPLWTTNKKAIFNQIDKQMKLLDTYQGKLNP